MLVAFVMVAIIGISAAAVPPTIPPKVLVNTGTEISSNETVSVEQSVQGQGYSVKYIYANVNNVELKEYAHGSGALDEESILTTYSANKTTHLGSGDWNDFEENCIQFQQTVNSWTYAPFSTIIGTGDYAQPVNYESLLKEKTWVKNRRAATSIQNEIEYAHAIRKDISAIVKEKTNVTYDPVFEGVGFTELRINEDVTDGKVHIGALKGAYNADNMFAGSITPKINWMAWRNPDLEIDEDYIGTYHIEKNITISTPYKWNKPSGDWLPCCSGGWDTMPAPYKGAQGGFGSSAKGIFDCTCYKWPQTAQFPEPKNP